MTSLSKKDTNSRDKNSTRRNNNDTSKIEKRTSEYYDEILNGSPPKKAKYSEPKRISEYERHLQGPPQNKHGGRRTQKLRGFNGNSSGAAGPCRTLSAEGKARVQADLRSRQII